MRVNPAQGASRLWLLWMLPFGCLAAVLLLIALGQTTRSGDSESDGIRPKGAPTTGNEASRIQSLDDSREPEQAPGREDGGTPASSEGSDRSWILRGTVFEHDGTPVRNAIVVVYRPRPPEDESGIHDAEEVARTTTALDGQWSTVVEMSGDYHVCAFAATRARVAIQDVSVRSPETTVTLTFDLPGAIAGVVIDAQTGEPLAGVEVSFSSPHSSWFPEGAFPERIRQFTGADGRFGPIEIDIGPKSILFPASLVSRPSPFGVIFVRDGYQTNAEEYEVTPGRVTDKTVRLRRAPEPLRFRVRVVDEAGRPVSEADLELHYVASDGARIGAAVARTDHSGRATMVDRAIEWQTLSLVGDGSYSANLWLAAHGFRPAVERLESLQSGETRDVEFVLAPSGRISGTVVGDDGRGRSGVEMKIRLIDNGGRWNREFGPPSLVRQFWKTETAADGTFVFDSLLEGTYSMRLFGPGLEIGSVDVARTFKPGDTDVTIVKKSRR